MATTTKKEIIDRIASETRIHRDQVKTVVTQFLGQLIEEVGKGNRLEFRDFGVFEVRIRGPRQAQNPKTLAPVMVEERRTVKFKVGRKMREALDKMDSSVLLEAKPRRRGRARQQNEVKPVGATASQGASVGS